MNARNISPAVPNSPRQEYRSFEYKKLRHPTSQIRLLELDPSDDFARPIHCKLQDAYITHPPPYKALSYYWGPNDLSHSVIIDHKVVAITSSLDSAIRHLRHPQEPVVIWIDQICVDQGNTSEKNEQVKMMAQIYTRATQVLVWLGPADRSSDDAMDLYREVGDAIWERNLHEYCNRDMIDVLGASILRRDPGDQLWQLANAVLTLTRELLLPRLQSMVDWDRRQWFSRVWVIQEFCVGADAVFVCGHKRIPVDYVKTTRLLLCLGQTPASVDAVRALGDDKIPLLQAITSDDPTPSLFSARVWRQRYQQGRSPGNTLFELLCKAYVGHAANATLPVDRIFSLLGLANDRDRLGIDVDYTKGATEVLTGCAKAILNRGNLTLLAYAQSPKDVAGLPSWVPDWRPNLRPSFYPYPVPGSQEEPYFNPSGILPPDISQDLNDNTVLGLRGFTVDTVEDVGNIWTDDAGVTSYLRYQNLLAQVRCLCRLSASKNQPIYACRRRRDEAEWRVPIADIWEAYEANEAGASQRKRATARAMSAYLGQCSTTAWFESGGLEPYPLADDANHEASFYRLSMSRVSGMRPFMTHQGYVGMGPPGMRKGDVVTVLFGARVCSILRHKGVLTNMAKQYIYIGEAYCDGVMDGELVGWRSEEVFHLV